MRILEQRILKDGKVRPGGILKVDGFLNHQMDIRLFHQLADELYTAYGSDNITKIFTIEASGIGLACIAGERFGCPVLFAKKTKTKNIDGEVYKTSVMSYTHGNAYDVIVSKEYLLPTDRVLLIDDFLANGEAIRGLCEIVDAAGAELVGIGCAVEKGFQGGGDRLRAAGVNLKSLAIIESAEPGHIVYRDGED